MGGIACLRFICESTGRMVEYNVFTIPRVLEGLWDLLNKTGLVGNWQYGEKFIFCISMAFLVAIHKYYSDLLPRNYRLVLDFILGKSLFKKDKVNYLKDEELEIKEVDELNEQENN